MVIKEIILKRTNDLNVPNDPDALNGQKKAVKVFAALTAMHRVGMPRADNLIQNIAGE
jgi:hypothetical protein